MALWLIRAGGHGEHEARFLDESRVYLTWEHFNRDLAKLKDVLELRAELEAQYPHHGAGKVRNHASQIWPFAKEMTRGDWFVTPSKQGPYIHVGEIDGDYVHHPAGPSPYFHYRKVKWIAKGVSRGLFGEDLLYSFGAFMTICEIRRNDAEARVRAMAKTGFKASVATVSSAGKKAGRVDEDEVATDEVSEAIPNLEELGRDAIAKLILAKFKGHGVARLVDAILKAQGYTTHVSPAGPDKGVDILAAPEPLGFGTPRLCVQVKSGQSPIDRPTLDQLVGAMQNFHAQQGLLVSWGGFNQSVLREVPAQFFRVRLWDQNALINQIIEHYDKLDPDIRAELPLKRVWTVAAEEDE